MSDDKAKEQGLEQQEEQERPTPVVPSVASSGETSGSKDDAAALERMEAKIEELLSRKVQSIKDKRIAELEKKFSQLAEALEAEDAAPSEVPGRTERKAQESGQGDGDYMIAMTEQILDRHGIAYDDPEYVGLAQKWQGRISNPERWATVVREWAETKSSKVSKQQSVTPAARTTSPGSTADIRGAETVDEIGNMLHRIQRGEFGSPFTPENKSKMDQLKAKLNELDPPVNLDDPSVHVDLSALYQG